MRKTLLIACSGLLILSACKKEAEEKLKNTTTTAVTTSSVTNYYVNGSTGSDANAGTSDTLPLKTIQAALWKTSDGVGATIWVAAGTYKEKLWWPYSGADSTHPITLTNYNGGTVILDGVGASNGTQKAMIAAVSRSHVRINNITVANNTTSSAVGILFKGSGTDIQVTGCKIYNIGWTTDSTASPASTDNANPLMVWGDALASYNKVYIGSNQIYSCNTGYSEGLTMAGNVENFLIESNVVHHIRNIGIDMTGHYSWANANDSVNMARNGNVKYNIVYNCISPIALNGGIYVDGGKYINIEGNICYNNYAGISAGCENNNYTATGINIRDNFIYNSRNAGILVGSNQANSKVTYSTIMNNSLYKNNTDGGWGGEISLQNTDYVTIKNNIVYSASDIMMIALWGYSSTHLVSDYNLYYGASGSAASSTFDWYPTSTTYGSLAAFTAATGLDAHSTYGNPNYVSATNLHLGSTSPAINAGDPSFVLGYQEFDIDKQSRIQNSRVDKGADETAY
ncbi:right-handed parallel beta-helix repeat-containing protein [Chitinophaga sancti]|uniref:Right handed beta helix region n=1 Tax=Chitinophaga sancti TaxID=1004 RepID=A0A1K1RCI7_9BACT|nr:right-handed parallel beta-helix repeat-containing protein [Chitinophaga sancti]WQD65591.1 right-handed parallel beta-helix repeat-containing protein [Chitinophaga sancti]WQG88786.1 right-handed parallel beta-helix repeat-containing protein [Chitinophaga sancti]SFW69531.1 Right handed beta helix region [Chitinophaga sancti]